MMLRERGYDTVTERRLFTLEIASPGEFPDRVGLSPGNFACLLAWDARGVPVDVISTLVEKLLIAGACYFVCWGPDCERAHDIIDEIDADPGSRVGAPAGSVVMTTWHESEPLAEAVFFFLVCAHPDAPYEDSIHSALAVSIGSPRWAAELGTALAGPREFITSVCKSDGA